MPDFSRLQVGERDIIILQGERPHEDLIRLGGTLREHLGFRGVIIQLKPGEDLNRLDEKAGRRLHRALAEVYGDA